MVLDEKECIPLGYECYLDVRKRNLLKDGLRIALSNTQFDILHYLACHIGRVIPTKILTQRIWDNDSIMELDRLYVYINRIRERLEDDKRKPKCLLSLRGVGYVLYPRIKS